MTSALVQNSTVIAFYPGSVPSPLSYTGLDSKPYVVAGSSDALIGSTLVDGSKILPATYVDIGPPLPQSYENTAARSYAIVSNTVQVTRTWITPAQSPVAVQVNSASTPALNGPYALSWLSAYASIAQQVQATESFPNGRPSLVINDVTGVPHSFTTTAFLAFYNALAYYSGAIASGQTPKTPLSIP